MNTHVNPRAIDAAGPTPTKILAARDARILALRAEGYTGKRIAAALGMPDSSVSTRIEILRRAGHSIPAICSVSAEPGDDGTFAALPRCHVVRLVPVVDGTAPVRDPERQGPNPEALRQHRAAMARRQRMAMQALRLVAPAPTPAPGPVPERPAAVVPLCEPTDPTPPGEQMDAHVRSRLRVLRLAHAQPVQRVVLVTAEHFGIAPSDITGTRRLAPFVLPRQIAMWVARDVTALSWPEIGRRIGGRDHTTVLHGVGKIERLRHERADVAAAIEAIRAELARVAEVRA